MVKNPPANAGDVRDAGLIPGTGRSAGGRHGNPLQYSCLETRMDRGAWRATVPRVGKSHIGLSDSPRTQPFLDSAFSLFSQQFRDVCSDSTIYNEVDSPVLS